MIRGAQETPLSCRVRWFLGLVALVFGPAWAGVVLEPEAWALSLFTLVFTALRPRFLWVAAATYGYLAWFPLGEILLGPHNAVLVAALTAMALMAIWIGWQAVRQAARVGSIPGSVPLGVGLSIGVAVVVCTAILWRRDYMFEVRAMVGGGGALLVLLGVAWFWRIETRAMVRPQMGALLVLLAALGAPTLAHHRRALLSGPATVVRGDAGVDDTKLLGQKASGQQRASFRWLELALGEGLTTEGLIQHCPRRATSVITGQSRVAQAIGNLCADRKQHTLPTEAGLGSLPPEFHRLSAEGWLDAGYPDKSAEILKGISSLDKSPHRVLGARRLWRWGHRSLARAVEPGDLLMQSWQRHWRSRSPREERAAWKAWGRWVNPGSVAVADYARYRAVDAPGDLMSHVDQRLGRRVARVRTRYAHGFAVEVAPTPGHLWPDRFEVELRPRRGFRFTLDLQTGVQHTWQCEGLKSTTKHKMWAAPETLCRPGWSRASIEIPVEVRDSPGRLLIRGDYSLARLTPVFSEGRDRPTSQPGVTP